MYTAKAEHAFIAALPMFFTWEKKWAGSLSFVNILFLAQTFCMKPRRQTYLAHRHTSSGSTKHYQGLRWFKLPWVSGNFSVPRFSLGKFTSKWWIWNVRLVVSLCHFDVLRYHGSTYQGLTFSGVVDWLKRRREIIDPRCSMYGIFTYSWVIFGVNVGKYSIHGASGYNYRQKREHIAMLSLYDYAVSPKWGYPLYSFFSTLIWLVVWNMIFSHHIGNI